MYHGFGVKPARAVAALVCGASRDPAILNEPSGHSPVMAFTHAERGHLVKSLR
jgi:hypothetical protein